MGRLADEVRIGIIRSQLNRWTIGPAPLRWLNAEVVKC